MDVTITNTDQEPKRFCQNCGSSIEKGNAKRQYCSDTCKVSHHRRKQAQAIRLNEQTVKQQQDKIQELSTRPVKRTSSVRVVNPAWQLVKQAYTAKVKICHDLDAQLKDLELEEHKMRPGSKGASYGAATGVSLAICLIAASYDTRQNKKIGMAFIVGSLFIIIVMGIIGYWIGKQCHIYLLYNKEQANIEIAKISQKRDELERKMNVEQQFLDGLQYELGQLNQYESEVITSVDETHV